jgi:GT2 family glycosyltransferase/glycosyltransferase involved in cell wall biosynthesis
LPDSTPIVLVYATSEKPRALARRFGVAVKRLRATSTPVPASALAEAGATKCVILLHGHARLASTALLRFMAAAEASPADVISALDDQTAPLSPATEGDAIECDDIDALDRAAASFGTSDLLPTNAWSPVLSCWRPAALAQAPEMSSWGDQLLPDTLIGAVVTRCIATLGRTLRGPASPDDPRFPRATDALEPVRARFRPLPGRFPAHPGQDGRPVVLHILHGWGGGAERYVRDLASADDSRCHLLLRARGDAARRRHGECLELALAADPAQLRLRQWPLTRTIAATAVRHDEYRAILTKLCAEFAVDTIVVSSLIGHALDVFATGLPTVVVCHDYYPAWPVLHIDFGAPDRTFDDLELARDMRDPGEPMFIDRNAQHWRALRAAYVEALDRAQVQFMAPSATVFSNLDRILPGLPPRRRWVIPHGFAPFARQPTSRARPSNRRPRVLVLGRINGGKGEVLLDPLITELRGEIDLYLLGCGNAGQRFFGRSGVYIELDYVRDDLPDLVERIAPDIAVLPVTVAETFSYTLSELRALSVPVLATRVGALAERIADGVDGHLSEPEPKRLASRLRELLAAPGLLAASAAAGRSRVRSIAEALRDHAPLLPGIPRLHGEASAVPPEHRIEAERALSALHAAHAQRERNQRKALAVRVQEQDRELERRADWGHTLDRQARELSARTEATYAKLRQLEAELAERAAWATQLDRDLATARDRILSLQDELEERTAWAQARDADVDAARQRILSLQRDLDERTAWARSLNDEIVGARDLLGALGAELESRTIWARSLDVELEAARTRIRDQGFELDSVGAWAKSLQSDLDLAQARIGSLSEDLETRLAWARSLDTELSTARTRIDELNLELVARTSWALSLDAELNLARERLTALDQELADRTTWARMLDGTVHELKANASRLEAEIESRDGAILSLEGELEATRGRLQSKIEELTEMQEAERQAHLAEIVRLAAADAESRAEAARLREQMNEAHADLDRTRTTLEDARADLATRTRERDELLASTSWRITAPLRAIVLFARRVRTSLRFRAGRALGLLTRTRMSLRTRGPAGTLRRIREYVDPPPPPSAVAVLPKPQDQPDFQPFAVPTTTSPAVSIVIPVYNHFAHTRTCLESLAANPGSIGFEVIVVDDCSSDATPELLPRIGGIRVLRNAQNLGFIGACNAGLAAARGDYVVFLNNDTAVQPGWLEALVSTFTSRPDCGLAGAKLVYPDGRLQEAGGIVFNDGSGWNYGRFGDPADAACNYVREVDYCSGAAIMLRRDLLAELGGFDPLYAPAYYEDTDLAFRVRARGLKVYYQPAAVVVHFEGVSSGTDTSSGVKRYQVVNQQKFLDRWRDVLASHPAPGTPIPIAREHRVRGRVLVIDACTPTPDQDSGSVRMVNTMRALIDLGWKVAFVAENRAWDPKYTPPLQQLGVEMLYHPWFADAPKWLAEHGDEIDCVVLSRHYVAAPLIDVLKAYAPRARRIFDTVDLHFLREERYAALSGSAEAATQARATRTQELAVMRACELTWVVSETERTLLADVAPDVRVDLLSNVHEVVGNRRGFDARRDLWFVGGFQHTPNVDAMLWFCGEIWPAIATRLPEARFHIVGSKMPAEIKALEGPRIVVHGHVESLDGFLDDCRLSVAPLRYGAGVKGKINSAMAHGQPVVATPIAVEGMHLTDGDSVLVAETAADFADAVVRLYEDRVLWERLSAAGVANVQTHFSFDAARAALERALPAPRRW